MPPELHVNLDHLDLSRVLADQEAIRRGQRPDRCGPVSTAPTVLDRAKRLRQTLQRIAAELRRE